MNRKEEQSLIGVRFHHGLGDCSNFAFQIPLWTKRGYTVEVDCSPDKHCMLESAGAKIVANASLDHGCWHPPPPGRPTFTDHYHDNKPAWQIDNSVMPTIGSHAELWNEYLDVQLNLDRFVTDAIRAEVDRFLAPLPRPIILTALQGNTAPDNKDLPHNEQAELLKGLLQRTDGTIVSLDWDNRVYKLSHYRVRHTGDDWGRIDLPTLYQLMQQSDLGIFVDTGSFHFARFTSLPVLGLWIGHNPVSFALPRGLTVNLTDPRHNGWTRYRRQVYQIVEGAVTGASIAELAARMLGPRRFLPSLGPDTVLSGLVDKLRQQTGYHPYLDRDRSATAVLSHLKGKAAPVMVETGCIRSEEDFTAGMSTYVYGFFLRHHGGSLQSVDLDGNNCRFARQWTADLPVTVHQSDSRAWLRSYNGPKIDCLYLDSADIGTDRFQEICLAECQAGLPLLAADALLMIDDSPRSSGRFNGKGGTAIPYLLSHGWRVLYGGYQVVLTR